MNDVVEIDQPLGWYAGDLFDRGREYLAAFKFLNDKEERFLFVGYFLLFHAVELLLKSFAASNGLSKRESRKIGHDIKELLEACEERKIPHIENLSVLVHQLAHMNKRHDFRYPTDYRLSVPRPDFCIQIIDNFISVIEPTITMVRIDALLDFSADKLLKGKKVRWSD